MGYKIVCLTCRKSFNCGIVNKDEPKKCSECGNKFVPYPHRFRPPEKDDLKAWKVVRFLFDHGFFYQHVYANKNESQLLNKKREYIDYPNSMIDAKEFVLKYENQAIK